MKKLRFDYEFCEYAEIPDDVWEEEGLNDYSFDELEHWCICNGYMDEPYEGNLSHVEVEEE